MTSRFPAGLRRELTVSALVLGPQRSVLLVDHTKLGVWLYPGGHVEATETPDEAVVREVEEETGLRVAHVGPDDRALSHPPSEVAALRRPYRVLTEPIADATDPHWHLDLIYACAVVGGQLVDTDDVSGVGFFTAEQAAALPTFPSFRVLLAAVYADDELWSRVAVPAGPAGAP